VNKKQRGEKKEKVDLNLFCDSCEKVNPCYGEEREEIFPVKGEEIKIVSKVMVCSKCGEDIYYDELEEKNLEMAYEKYREKKGLLGPKEIKKIRKKYGLSQRGISLLLGWSPATIARYEAGSIPNKSHNEQLRLFSEKLDYAKELFEEKKQELNREDIKRFSAFLERNEGEIDKKYFQNHIIKKYSGFPDGYRGNRSFDLTKLENMIYYFIYNEREIVKSKLLKLLWYSDFIFFKKFNVSITGTPYCKNHFGPIPFNHESIIAYLQEINAIEIKPHPGPYEGEVLSLNAEFEKGLFFGEEIEVMNYVLEKFKGKSAGDMSKISHEEKAYKELPLKQLIPYHYSKYIELA